MTRALLLDLDDTLYDYAPCEEAGRARLVTLVRERWGTSPTAFAAAYDGARTAVKARFSGPSNHSRLLYVHELLHGLGRAQGKSPPPIHVAATLEREFWSAYLSAAHLRPGAVELLSWFRESKGKIAIVTDLTLDIQLRKLEHLGLWPHVDALVASEEVGHDKPHPAAFHLASARLDVALSACVMAGDNDEKDGAGARALGLPFYLIRTPTSPTGLTLAQLKEELSRRDS